MFQPSSHPRAAVLAIFFLAQASLALAACATETRSSGDSSASDESDLTLFGDPTRADPNNAWMRGVDPSRLRVGEEVVLPNEEADFKRFVTAIHDMQDKMAARNGGQVGRAFHQKQHACVRGELHIDVPANHPEAKVGLFATNATYPAWVRLSNGVGFVQRDKASDARGFAVKVMKVPGRKLLVGSETAQTQDFLAINSSVQPAADVAHFIEFGRAVVEAEVTGDDPSLELPGGIRTRFPGVDFGPLKRMFLLGGFLLKPENERTRNFILGHILQRTILGGSLLGEQYFSGAAVALGVEAMPEGAETDPLATRAKQAVRYKFVGGVLEGSSCRPVTELPNFRDDDYLKRDLSERIKTHDGCARLMLQFQKDPAKQLIEDTSVPWNEADTPFIPVGYVVLPRTDLSSPAVEADQKFCSTLGFTPWHTLPEHRPLGNMMRARRFVYEASREHRGGDAEPTGDE